MAIVAKDWTVDRQTGNIRYVGSDHGVGSSPEPSYATVIELHRWLQGMADDAEYTGDDEVDIINTNPSTRSTDNIITLNGTYNIDATAAEHLYDGSIIQRGGAEVWDGIVNFGNSDVVIQVIQNGAVLSDDWWNQVDTTTSPWTYYGLNADAGQGISHRFMIKIRDQSTSPASDIDGRRLIGTCRTFGNTYGEFKINGTARGNNVLALSDSSDLNNTTAAATVATWTGITNLTEGYALLDVDNNGTPEAYYSEWDRDTYTINQYYERMKWLTRDGSSSTLYGLNGELFRGITHEITIDNVVNTFPAYGALTWATGTGQLLAINSTGSPEPTKMWIQLLTGTAPTDGVTITCTDASPLATADVNVTVTDRSALIAKPFVGQSTGSALIGSYGLGLQTTDLSATDKVFDLTNTQITPPNNVTFTVGGLIAAEDYVLVGPWDGSSLDADGNPEIDYDQLLLATTLSGASETAVVVTAAIPSDTPSSGTIRVQTDSGFYQLCSYTSFTGSTFTITAENFSADNATAGTSPEKNVFITYLDKLADGSPEGSTVSEAFSFVYGAGERDFVIKVRDGGGTPIKEYIATGTMGSNGGSTNAIRTVDA